MAGNLPLREILSLGVFFLSLTALILLQPPQVKVSELKGVGKLYKVCGTLIPLKSLQKGCIYKLVDETGEIKAISFSGSCEPGYACLYGRIDEYRGEKELVILAVD